MVFQLDVDGDVLGQNVLIVQFALVRTGFFFCVQFRDVAVEGGLGENSQQRQQGFQPRLEVGTLD